MRTYTMVSSGLLLIIGVIGFAFNESFQIPYYILITNIILGIWGMYSMFKK